MHPDHHETVDSTDFEGTFRFIQRMNLSTSIASAFKNGSATELRKWYIQTFILDPFNQELLSEITIPQILSDKLHGNWPTTEHGAIGMRLVHAIDPNIAIGRLPNLMVSDEWKNPVRIANLLLFIYRPWETMRYDPHTENWFRYSDGAWRRFGKGSPSNGAVEPVLRYWTQKIDVKDEFSKESQPLVEAYSPKPTEMNEEEEHKFALKLLKAQKHLSEFAINTTAMQKVRSVLEQMQIMHIDSETLDHFTGLNPYPNGMLALEAREFEDSYKQKHIITPGDLLPQDQEFMCSTVNPIAWPDSNIPEAFRQVAATDFNDWYELENIESQTLDLCPTYNSFLDFAFPELKEKRAFLRLLGAALFGSKLKIVAAMIGKPNAGKDTVINWLSYLLEERVATLPFSVFTGQMEEDKGFAPLRGAKVATVSGEVGSEKGSKILAEKLKTVTSGGGKIRVAEKYEKPTTVFFDGMLVLQGNSVPPIAGGDEALYTNRLVAVEFKNSFPLTSVSYDDKYRTEAKFFMQVLFINFLKYQHSGGGMRGINPPDNWKTFAKQFADTSNQFGFIESCIYVDPEAAIPTTQFHKALTELAQRYGTVKDAPGPHFWPKRLRALGYDTGYGPNTIRKRAYDENGKQIWVYTLGIDAEKSDGVFTQQLFDNLLAISKG